MSKEEVYKSNIKILYEDLRNAIDDYVEHGHITGDVRFVNAYLMATIGAILYDEYDWTMNLRDIRIIDNV